MSAAITSSLAKDPFEFSHLCRYFSEDSPQPIVAVAGPTHIIRYLNPAFAKLARRSSGELIGRPFAEVVPEAELNGFMELLDDVFHSGTPKYLAEQEDRQTPPAYWSYSMWGIRGTDGCPVGVMIQVTDATEAAAFRRRAVAMNEALVVSSVEQHELIATIRRNEIERQELQLQLFQAQKLESLGVLAGGIAHDLNNMLTPVLGYAELAARLLNLDSPVIPMLEAVEKNAKRAANLVQQILAFAGKGQFQLHSVVLSDLVREMADLLEAAVSVNTTVVYELAPSLPLVDADASQLRQFVMNLVSNAADSIGDGIGTITIRTGVLSADRSGQHSPFPRSYQPTGAAIFLEVQDSGCGMTAELIEKIFDPFFTTKFVGRGLGLAAVQGIARGHRGTLEVHSKPGVGSTFRLILPCSIKTTPTPVATKRMPQWRGTGVVLVVDDEKEALRVTSRVLEGAGLGVLVAHDGLEALAVFHKHQERITAVLMDLTMPRMNGLEAARELRKLRSTLPIVLMSGYTVEDVASQSVGLGINEFVKKPFLAIDLLEAMRKALGQ